MKASVVLCTYNRAAYLQEFLETSRKQTFPISEYELIIVNDGSTDETDMIINNFQNALPIRYVKLETNVGKDKAVFLGAEQANTDYLLFTDDDCLPDSNWIEAMVLELETSPLVSGRISSPEHPYLTLCRNISEFHEFMGSKQIESIHFLAGANMGIRREVLKSIGRIPATSTSFDTNLAFHAVQNGFIIRFAPTPTIRHQPENKPFSALWEYEIKRAFMTIQLRYKFRSVLGTPFFLQSSWLVLLLSPFIALGRSIQIFLKTPIIHWLHAFPVVVALKFAWCWGSFKGLRYMGR